MILLIDNYDSFTYNLYQLISELGVECQVHRNDEISLDEVQDLKPQALVISPGPGSPKSAGVSANLIKRFAGRIPVLGVCLGHQSIGEVFGGSIVRAKTPRHGKMSKVFHDGQGLFLGLPNPFLATRYHSLIVEEASLPDCLEISARTDDGVIMGLRHREFLIEGVQFHPESVATESGRDLVANFILLKEA